MVQNVVQLVVQASTIRRSGVPGNGGRGVAEKYLQAYASNQREVVREVGGSPVVFIRFRGILKYKVDNPDFRERPEGPDTRRPNEKRREVWQQVTKTMEVRKERGKKQTERNISDALQSWREELERDDVAEEAGKSVYQLVREYIDWRASITSARTWRTVRAARTASGRSSRRPSGTTTTRPRGSRGTSPRWTRGRSRGR